MTVLQRTGVYKVTSWRGGILIKLGQKTEIMVGYRKITKKGKTSLSNDEANGFIEKKEEEIFRRKDNF